MFPGAAVVGASRRGRMSWIASVCCCTADNCWANPSTVSPNSPASEMGASRKHALSTSFDICQVEVPETLTVTLRSPRAPAGGPRLEPERPAQVVAEGANPLRKERQDRSEVMLICPQQARESSTNASSACWRHWRQRSCPSSVDRKRPQPEGHRRNGILKKTQPSVICSFRICSFSWSAQGNRCWEGLRWLHRDTNQEQIKDERLVEISTLLIHLAPKQKYNEWMHLSPFYTHMHGEWLRSANSTSQYSLAFSLKVRDDWGFQVNPLCHHDITRSDWQMGNHLMLAQKKKLVCDIWDFFLIVMFQFTIFSIRNFNWCNLKDNSPLYVKLVKNTN